MNRSHPLKTVNSLVFYASCLLLLASCWQRNEFPAGMPLGEQLLREPVQESTRQAPFRVEYEGVDYTVEPRYAYDLRGLVVSYAHHDGNYSLHRLWNDHLNVADICVVWGANADTLNLNRFDFWNGKFTCNFKTSDATAWEQFREHQISNNHLLAADDLVRRMIGKVRIGDQIRVHGWLSRYSNEQGFSRDTSTTRNDRGNGACETIFVRNFTILQSMDNGWRRLMNIAWFGVIATSLIWFVAVARGVF